MKKISKVLISLFLIGVLSTNIMAAVLYSPGANTGSAPSPIDYEPEATPIKDSVLTDEAIKSISSIIVNDSKIVDKSNGSKIIASQVVTPSPIVDSYPDSTAYVTSSGPSNNIFPSTVTSYTTANVSVPVPQVSAPAFIVMNATTKQIYAGKDFDKKYEPAGLANLMTAYLGSVHKQYSDMLSVSLKAAKVDKDASIAGLDKGDTISLNDAIASMFVKSCADSANVIAENVSGDIDTFIELMNETAKTMGCTNTNFVNTSGLNNDAQLTTAYDMGLIMDYVTAKPELVKLMSLSTYTLPAAKRRDKLILYSRNTMLSKDSPNYNADVTCSRMGYTSKTGYTMASMCNYKGNRLIVVILKETGSHFENTKKLIDFAKLAYEETK